MVKKIERKQGHGTNKDGAGDALFVSIFQGNLEKQIKLMRGPLASHVLPSTFDMFIQKTNVYEEILEFIETTKPSKQVLVDFIAGQVQTLQEKLSSAPEQDREHLQNQIEIYSTALLHQHFSPRE